VRERVADLHTGVPNPDKVADKVMEHYAANVMSDNNEARWYGRGRGLFIGLN
jgi:hypothetical protein